MPALFARAVEQIIALDPDLFVLSGDLIDYPLELMDDPFLRVQAVKDLKLIQGLLSKIECPSAVVYGNHDHPELFHQVFESLSVDQIANGVRVLAFLDDEGPGNIPVRSGKEQRRFEAALTDTTGLPQIHVQHYVVWPPRNDHYPHTYGDGEHMRTGIVANGNVRLVLSGHYHIGVEPAQSDGVWFATVSAFGEYPHPFWVYDLGDDGLAWQQHEVSA